MTVALLESPEQKKKWIPKTWKPRHSEVVALHAVGFKNIEIAEKMGKTPVWVSLVLNTPHAKILLREVFNNLEKNLTHTIDENLSLAATKAAERIRQYLCNDAHAENQPIAMVDRAFKVLSALGKTRTQDQEYNKRGGNMLVNNGGNMFIMSDEAAKDIAESIRLSKEVDKLHLGHEIVIEKKNATTDR